MTKKELLHSIRPDMQLTKAFLLQVYGYTITDPTFAETALSRLEDAGCNMVREYYRETVNNWQIRHDAEVNRAALWYRQKVEEDRQKEATLWLARINKMTEAEAKTLLKKMLHC